MTDNNLLDAYTEYAELEGTEVGEGINFLIYSYWGVNHLEKAFDYQKQLFIMLNDVIEYNREFEECCGEGDLYKKWHDKYDNLIKEQLCKINTLSF